MACNATTGTDKTFHRINLSETPLYLYPTISSLCEAPVSYPETWNREALMKLDIHRIVMYSKGGKNPDDTLEKITFSYDSNWNRLSYTGYKYNESSSAWTSGKITGSYSDGKIQFIRHYGISKNMEIKMQAVPNGYMLLHSKTNLNNDTTWVMGTFEKPKAIISKIGNSLFSVDLFLPEGSSTSDIIALFKSFPETGGEPGSARCTITFTESGRPQRTFLLNEVFSQVAKVREWTYTADNNIATYNEWTGNVLTNQMTWHYGKTQLPDYTIINRNTYFYHYE